MGRRGFSSGGRGGVGGGGGGGGLRPACRSKASRDAEGNILIQRAAASNGFRSAWDRFMYGPDNSHEDLCKSLVINFEMCVLMVRGDRDSRLCQEYKRELEEHCDEFRSSWNDWWAEEKKRECDIRLKDLEWCLRRHGKESEKCQYEMERLKGLCDIQA